MKTLNTKALVLSALITLSAATPATAAMPQWMLNAWTATRNGVTTAASATKNGFVSAFTWTKNKGVASFTSVKGFTGNHKKSLGITAAVAGAVGLGWAGWTYFKNKAAHAEPAAEAAKTK